MCNDVAGMARKYELKKRAERQQETRQRIAEAALALHSEQGPLRTTISAIADRAGVQRHTVYSHFPEAASLYMACSGVFAESNPAPAADALRAISDPNKGLRAGLANLYQLLKAREHFVCEL